MHSLVDKYGFPEPEKKKEIAKWGFSTLDGTTYDSLTDAIDADVADFKKPDELVAEHEAQIAKQEELTEEEV